MSDVIETIYNRYIADEKLKSGSKFERLAAVVFKLLDEQSTVINDLRLRGEDKKAAHQIDAVIGKEGARKRILVECKDYDKVVGIDVVRNFFGAISQLKPDEAFVVTTKGFTRGAINFAEDEGIKLANIREFEENDWEGRMTKIHLVGRIKVKSDPHVTFIIDKYSLPDEDSEELLVKLGERIFGWFNPSEVHFLDKSGKAVSSFRDVIEPIIAQTPCKAGESVKGEHIFEDMLYIDAADKLLGIKGFAFEFSCDELVSEHVIDEGNRIAVLLFKIFDGSIDWAVFDDELSGCTFNNQNEVFL